MAVVKAELAKGKLKAMVQLKVVVKAELVKGKAMALQLKLQAAAETPVTP